MPVRYREKATGELFFADTPEAIAAALQDPSFERYDLPQPALFVDKQTGERLAADDLDQLAAARTDSSLRPATPAEQREQQEKDIAASRSEAESAAAAEYLKQHPVQTGAAAFAQQFAKTAFPIPFVAEKAIGINLFGPGLSPEEQERLVEASPIAAGLGTYYGFGAAIPAMVASGGASLEAQAAGKTAALAAEARGAGKLAQAVTAGAKTLTAPISKADVFAPVMGLGGRTALAAEAALQTAVPGLKTGIIGRGVTGAVGAGVASGAVGVANQIEQLLRQENQISQEDIAHAGEAVLHDMKIGSMIGGAVGGAVGAAESLKPLGEWISKTEAGREWAAKFGKSRAERIYRKHAPGVLSKVQTQIQPEQSYQLINEAADQGLVGVYKNPIEQMQAVQAAKNEAGKTIGQISAEADATLGNAPTNVSKMWDAMVDDVIAPLSKGASVEGEVVSLRLADQLERYRNIYGEDMTLSELAKLRSAIDDEVYGATPMQINDPERTKFYSGLRQFRHAITKRIFDGVEKAGIDTGTWKAAQRQYQVISHAERVAAKALGQFATNNAPKGTTIENVMSLATALGSGTMSGLAMKLGLASLRTVVPRTANWAVSATERALRTGAAPEVMLADIKGLAEQQRAITEGKLTTLSLRPEDNAKEEFLSAYDRVLKLKEAMKASPSKYPKTYLDAVQNAQLEMEDAYASIQPSRQAVFRVRKETGRSPLLYGQVEPLFPPDTERLGDALERARNIFASASQPTRGAVAVDTTKSFIKEQQKAVNAMRQLRDDFTGLLADGTGMWGQKRLDNATEELKRLVATHSDPERLVRLQALQDKAYNTRKTVASKADKLMGVARATVIMRPKVGVKRSIAPVIAPAAQMEQPPEPVTPEQGQPEVQP